MSTFEALVTILSLMFGLLLHNIALLALFWWVLGGLSGKNSGTGKDSGAGKDSGTGKGSGTGRGSSRRRVSPIPRQHS